MAMHELVNNVKYVVGAAPVVITDNTAVTTGVIDMRGYEHAAFVILAGTLADADATFAVTMTHGDAVDNAAAPTAITDSAAAHATTLVGTLAAAGFTFAADGATRVVGYSPNYGAGKRYVRATVTPSGNAGAAPLAILVALKPLNLPAA